MGTDVENGGREGVGTGEWVDCTLRIVDNCEGEVDNRGEQLEVVGAG